MKRFLRRLWLKFFPRYIYLDRRMVCYAEAEKLMLEDLLSCSTEERWVLDTDKEDNNRNFGWVYLCRRRRIVE